MGSCLLIVAAVTASVIGQSVNSDERDELNKSYQKWWGMELNWKFDALPTQGSVPDFRLPYSGHIYPDTGGGTSYALSKYDRAFNGGRYLATSHERWDTSAFQEPTTVESRGGLFGLRRRMVSTMRTPGWYGHCNGWTAATIRHAHPQHSVVKNGVTFTRADIKALLAEIYMYSATESLGGDYGNVHPAVLHVSLTNWLGRHSHPMGMEASPGREKWNFPIYSFNSTVTPRGNGDVDVRTTVNYAYYSNGEFDQSPLYARQKYFHYSLGLDAEGRIVRGYFYRDSSIIDLLWVPVAPVQGGKKGNERGNPYVKVDEVLALWRASVSDEIVAKWRNFDTGELPVQIATTPKPASPEEKPAPAAIVDSNVAPATATAPVSENRPAPASESPRSVPGSDNPDGS